ncbi:hypothetical protein L3V82_06890 [Thiotrichales bacterium 19S3-7]|nr:hypothetical protein [Thiotrichales bacterium 19S3-7]MCF6801913.1 hypothetical protein [Thiotrichales bacterium 19S3-11]
MRRLHNLSSIFILSCSWSMLYATTSINHQPTHIKQAETIWTPTFYAIQPRTDIKNPVSMNFCLTHTPNTLKTTISEIKQGVKAENGVYLKYLSYKTTHQHGLGFNTVNAEVWLVDSKGKKIWSSPMWEYQQNLSDNGITNVVWATNQCKGKFIGVPNIIK